MNIGKGGGGGGGKKSSADKVDCSASLSKTDQSTSKSVFCALEDKTSSRVGSDSGSDQTCPIRFSLLDRDVRDPFRARNPVNDPVADVDEVSEAFDRAEEYTLLLARLLLIDGRIRYDPGRGVLLEE